MSELFTLSQVSCFFIAGPCALESLDLALETATKLAEIGKRLNVPVIFKSSFDKANRTSLSSFRGPGMELGLDWLATVKEKTGLPVITDIHASSQAEPVAEVADILQIPAFLCRQTDLLQAAAKTKKIVNVKKGQFLAPWDMRPVVDKLVQAGSSKIWLTERGASFGYNNLVVDMRSLSVMAELGFPVVFDATHSVQLPGGQGKSSGGERKYVPLLARAAAAAGCRGIFMEVHPEPDKALCDGANSWPLSKAEALMSDILSIQALDFKLKN